MMAMKFKELILFILALATSRAQMSPMPPIPSQTHADHGESHKTKDPPHGGTVVDAGKRHLEIVFDPFAGEQKLTVYVLIPAIN